MLHQVKEIRLEEFPGHTGIIHGELVQESVNNVQSWNINNKLAIKLLLIIIIITGWPISATFLIVCLKAHTIASMYSLNVAVGIWSNANGENILVII